MNSDKNNLTIYTLANGLKVLLKEIHTAPVISHWIWFRVGSRNETTGATGLSHWVEHMLFKGTQQFPPGELDKEISRDGGYWNAMTYIDWTTFYQTLPSHKIELPFQVESDRMINCVFDAQEVEHERTVIISERQGDENEPLFRLGESVQKAAFQNHPYRIQVIGEMDDLHSITRDQLFNHYRTRYQPSNAVLAIAGDFNTEEVRRLVDRYYLPIPSRPAPFPAVSQGESTIAGLKKVEITGQAEMIFMQIVYRAPAANEKDFFAISVLDSLLAGAANLNMFGGGGLSNKTSRLYQALVEKDLAVSVSAGLQATIDPFLYEILLVLHPNQDPQKALEAVDAEIARLQNEPIAGAELERSVRQARALFSYGSESITNQAFWLGHAEMFAEYEWFTSFLSSLQTIKPEDVTQAARKYLPFDGRVIGTYLPTGSND